MHQLLYAENLTMLLQTLHLQVMYGMMRQPWRRSRRRSEISEMAERQVRRDHFRASENCRDGMVPADWKEAMIISLYKGKGSRTVCSNHRPIALLSVPGKVFAHVLLERLQPLLTRQRGPQQSGFTRSSRQSTPYWHCVFWLNCKLNSENRSRWPT